MKVELLPELEDKHDYYMEKYRAFRHNLRNPSV